MYLSAMRAASIAVSKQSPGEDDATMGSGASPCLPHIACMRSACSTLVGIPVLGPALWMSQRISGSSVMMPSPSASDFRERLGPEEEVTARAPPKEAPRQAVMAAISSSAWMVTTPYSL